MPQHESAPRLVLEAPARRRRPAAGVATLIAIALAAPAGASAAATISGTVRDAEGRPITSGDVCVTTRQAATTELAFPVRATTRADGTYEITNLRPDSYVVEFRDCEGSTSGHMPAYFGGALVASRATVVTVGRDETRRDVDARLQPGAAITGTVFAGPRGDDRPLERICVSTEPVLAEDAAPVGDAGGAVTGADGRYVVRGLPELPDGYRVALSDCSGTGWLAAYAGGDTPSTARIVKPAVGTPVSGVDGRLTLGGPRRRSRYRRGSVS